MTEDVNAILNKLSDQVSQILLGSRDNKIEVLEQADLIRVYASAGKVFAVWANGSVAPFVASKTHDK